MSGEPPRFDEDEWRALARALDAHLGPEARRPWDARLPEYTQTHALIAHLESLLGQVIDPASPTRVATPEQLRPTAAKLERALRRVQAVLSETDAQAREMIGFYGNAGLPRRAGATNLAHLAAAQAVLHDRLPETVEAALAVVTSARRATLPAGSRGHRPDPRRRALLFYLAALDLPGMTTTEDSLLINLLRVLLPAFARHTGQRRRALAGDVSRAARDVVALRRKRQAALR